MASNISKRNTVNIANEERAHAPTILSIVLSDPNDASSETQGQIAGARESLNGRENMARRKVKNGEKSPWGQCLTRPVTNSRGRSGF